VPDNAGSGPDQDCSEPGPDLPVPGSFTGNYGSPFQDNGVYSDWFWTL